EAAPAAGAVVGLAALREPATAARAPVEHRERAVEALQHHFRRIAILAGLILPLAGLKLPLDVDLRALAQILLHHAAQVLVEDHDRMPLGALLALSGVAIFPVLAGRNSQVRDRAAV